MTLAQFGRSMKHPGSKRCSGKGFFERVNVRRPIAQAQVVQLERGKVLRTALDELYPLGFSLASVRVVLAVEIEEDVFSTLK